MGSFQSCPQKYDREIAAPKKRRVGVLLWGCETDEEHKCRIRMIIDMLRPLKGEEGLIASGMEYRLVTLQEDDELLVVVPPKMNGMATTSTAKPAVTTLNNENGYSCDECRNDDDEEKKEEYTTCRPLHTGSRSQRQHPPTKMNGSRCPCSTSTLYNKNNYNKTMTTRLFHKESNTMITTKNRNQFIADGAMYDIICRLAMEYSQEIMIRDGQLEWVTIAPAVENKSESEPIRALVSTRLVKDESRLDNNNDNDNDEPTLLIATGNGKVQAGVFSRQHLLTSGLECSSAVQFVREAKQRNMNVIIIDPNVHGDRLGMVTFEKSMMHLFRHWEEEEEEERKEEISSSSSAAALENDQSSSSPSLEQAQKQAQKCKKNLFVLSHSASGAQLMRYLLTKSECYLPRIRAIAFTDSTHNIQWTKRNNQEALQEFLESDECIYFKRSSSSNSDQNNIDDHNNILNPLSSIGEVVDTDEFWKHRFGNIKMLCAGTSEHSLTNWFARYHIWDHFDQYLATTR